MLEKRGEDHCAIGCEKIKEDMAHENRKADLIEAPEIWAFRDLNKNPAEEKRIKGDQ